MNRELWDVVKDMIVEAKNITVFTGAGISTGSGVPDFRGENGLYSFVQSRYNLPYPEAIFEINYFSENPGPFYDFSSKLMMDDVQPTLTHQFIAWLEKMGKIALVVTQNIDMLHQKAGTKKIFECHGTYETAHCLSCRKKFELSDFEQNLKEGVVKHCSCGGLVKPDIIFFGEVLPERFFDLFENPPETDLLLALGTSLSVQPACMFPIQLAQRRGVTNSVLINLQETLYDSHFTHVLHDELHTIFHYIWKEMEK